MGWHLFSARVGLFPKDKSEDLSSLFNLNDRIGTDFRSSAPRRWRELAMCDGPLD